VYRYLFITGILGTLGAVVGHYLVYGPKHPELRGEAPTVRRFNLWERLVHGVTMLSFVTLVVTGVVAVLAEHRLTGWLLLVHWVAAPFFAVGLAALTLTWSEFGRFEHHDVLWARHMGGYLGRGAGDLPAGMFNAGQKAFFWVVALLGVVTVCSGVFRMAPVFGPGTQAIVLNVHRYAALLLSMSIVVHLYLGTLANPGTFSAMLRGMVSRAWVRRHHPIWGRRLGMDARGSNIEPPQEQHKE